MPIVVSPAQEHIWGEEALRAFLQTRRLSGDGSLAIRVDDIGREVARVSDRPNVHYRFLVVEGGDLQAFSFPGGTVCLTEGLARLFATDGELAFALGHELAHIVLRHHVSRLRVEEALKGDAPGENLRAGSVTGVLDRDAEIEADRFGALYAVRAGRAFSDACLGLERLATALGRRRDRAHPEFLQRLGALQSFRRELERAVEAFRRGVLALGRGDADEAISMLIIFVSEFPNSAAARVNLGAAYLARSRMNSGVPLGLAEVLPILPDPGIVVRGPMDTLDLNRAQENFQEALALHPDERLAHAGLGLVFARRAEFRRAREHLGQARALERNDPEIVLCLGNVEHMAERYTEAVELYIEALRLRPDWAEARKNLALTYERLGRIAEARDLWSTLQHHEAFALEAHRHLEQLAD